MIDRGRLLFVYNPVAGRGAVKPNLSDIIETFCKEGYEVTVRATLGPKDATEYVIKYGESFDRIVCCGGDGTLNEVTDGLMALSKRPACGYISAGTMNDFAHSFELPKKMEDAAYVAATGTPYTCDIGEINGDFFDYVAAFGAFTEVAYETNQVAKNTLGKLAYFFEGVKRLAGIKKYKIHVKAEDVEFEDVVLYGMVTNSFSVGGFLSLFDDNVSLNDGLLEAFFIKAPKNILEMQTIVTALLSGDVNNEFFYYMHIKDIVIECEENISWTVDGEFGGSYKTARIVTHKNAISFIHGNNGKN